MLRHEHRNPQAYEPFIRRQVASGGFESADAVVAEALRRFAEEENGVRSLVVVADQKRAMEELLAELAALPDVAGSDEFSNRDHDRLIYGGAEK